MKNGKQGRVMLALLLAAVLALPGVWALRGREDEPAAQGNLLTNGDFSAVTGDMPDGWEKGMWVTSAGASYLEAVTLEDGTHAVLIENAAENDARFEQTVAVRPNATYRLTARVRAEGIDPAKTGANVSFLNIYGTSERLRHGRGMDDGHALRADGQGSARGDRLPAPGRLRRGEHGPRLVCGRLPGAGGEGARRGERA